MLEIPKVKTFNSIVSFFKYGYIFIQKTARDNNTDIFKIALPGKNVIFITGEEAAKVFYDNPKFIRGGAVPKRIQKSLVGIKAVHTLDDAKHQHRKEMFMSLMTAENIERLNKLVAQHWSAYVDKWEKMDEVVLFKESQEILCRAVCAWAGVPLNEEEVRNQTNDFIAMVDAFGAIGPRFWRGKRARIRTEKWIRKIIEKVRNKELNAAQGTPLFAASFHKDLEGKIMDINVAAVELINLLRPTVAISYYISFAAHALHHHPEYREKLKKDDENYMEQFINEVRRFYPIAPFMGANVREDFEWNNYQFLKDSMVMLDIYGTNHDPRHWERNDTFWPDNFSNWNKNPFDFIPQGGGHPNNGHRCPGEWITIEAMRVALKYLAGLMEYEVPEQDLSFSLKRLPTYPKSGFIMKNVNRK